MRNATQSLELTPTKLSKGVKERKNYLVHKLWTMGYTQDRVGKPTENMTLTELEQIHINLQCQKAREEAHD
ncbi:hypothetical protein MUN89_15810 [Halobacillus salinarum]|uniref:Fur-regulated basic protein FbpA n=1 Tax=Halobacillus salinarum TaxID=2932257 RepID=A0ABY4EMN8_9BACI|nr:hypothetical protein [Halobacillus salinarum]UOQ43376.1 hypothetical protein MUN89_15810 [Halobacillus salinarum]